MTRDEILARINALYAKLDEHGGDPLQSHSERLAISAPVLRELTALQEQLRALERGRPGD